MLCRVQIKNLEAAIFAGDDLAVLGPLVALDERTLGGMLFVAEELTGSRFQYQVLC